MEDHWSQRYTGRPLEAHWLPTILYPVAFQCTLGSKFQARWIATGLPLEDHWLRVRGMLLPVLSQSPRSSTLFYIENGSPALPLRCLWGYPETEKCSTHQSSCCQRQIFFMVENGNTQLSRTHNSDDESLSNQWFGNVWLCLSFAFQTRNISRDMRCSCCQWHTSLKHILLIHIVWHCFVSLGQNKVRHIIILVYIERGHFLVYLAENQTFS